MRELRVAGPAQTPSSVCTHCLSGSCDQHRGHKEVGTLLNSLGHEGLFGEVTSSLCSKAKTDKRTASHSEHTREKSTVTLEPLESDLVTCTTHTHTLIHHSCTLLLCGLGRTAWDLPFEHVQRTHCFL